MITRAFLITAVTILAMSGSAGVVFTDGFEFGTTDAWDYVTGESAWCDDDPPAAWCFEDPACVCFKFYAPSGCMDWVGLCE